MAPVNALKSERHHKVKLILDFAKTLPGRITLSPVDPLLPSDLESHISKLPLARAGAGSKAVDQLDPVGTDLWNLSTRLRRDEKSHDAGTLCLLRGFAFLLLDSAHRSSRSTVANCVRLLKVALRAVKLCLTESQLELAGKILECAAEYEELLAKTDNQMTPEDGQTYNNLSGEYYILRTALAWKHSRFDLAEHLFSKFEPTLSQLDPVTAEKAADVLFVMGKDLLQNKQLERAVRWLERAHGILASWELERLSMDAGELRFSIIQSLARALLGLNKPDTKARVRDLVSLMETDFGERMVTILLKLDLLSSEDSLDIESYQTLISRSFRTVVLTEKNFQIIMHHIHKINKNNPKVACQLLDEFLALRLFAEGKEEWIQKTSITRIWITTSCPEFRDGPGQLQTLFDSISRNTKSSFTVTATHAAQTLVWKRIEAAYAQGSYEDAESWCRLANHHLFERCGELNQAKIARKLILCALGRQDATAARQVFFQAPDTIKRVPMTQYLLYRVALRSQDVDLAAECLDTLCKETTHDATYLYACVLEAQQSGDRGQTVAALKKVLENHDYSSPPGVHVPALLRCTARLLIPELFSMGAVNEMVVGDLCNLFEAAATQAKKPTRKSDRPPNQDFLDSELDWFCKCSYNLAIQHCAELHPKDLVRLLRSCIEFIDLRSKTADEDSTLPLRRAHCNFVAANAYLALARAEDSIEASRESYFQVRRFGQNFRAGVSEHLETQERRNQDDLIAKHFEVVKFELEAVLKLGDWNAMDDFFEECWKYDSKKHYETLADLVLVIHSAAVLAEVSTHHQRKILAFLQKMISNCWRSASIDVGQLARWIRCLFQAALTFDADTALHCLDEAILIAANREQLPEPYPATELEWLATTTFNRAIDFYGAGDDPSCRLWAERALSLAMTAEAEGPLHSLLQRNFSSLNWAAKE